MVRNLVWWLMLSGSTALLMIDVVIGVPVPAREDKDIVLMPMLPTRFVQVPVVVNPPPFYLQQHYQALQKDPNYQTRGPFEFIGQWIQQTPWLPLEINVPDIFSNIGNGISQATNTVQQFGQNVGNGVSQFTQNVGTGVSQFTQNVGSGLNQFGNGFNQWMQQLGQRVPFLGNIVGSRVPTNGQQQLVVMVPVEYPGGQQLVLDEALEAFP